MKAPLPAELPSSAGSGPGFGLRLPSTINSPPSINSGQWLERCDEWVVDSGFVK
jgi:hypothetical protein